MDLRNTTIQSGHRTFAFHDGVTETGPVEPVPGKSEPEPQWRAEIEQGWVVRPARVRFLFVQDAHQTGSGWMNYRIGLRCSAGRIQEVFPREGLSLTVDRLDSTAVAVSKVEKAGDCKKFRWIYAWNGDRYDVIAMR